MIILASTSPRRIELMKAIHLPCEVAVPTAEEIQKKGESPQAMVQRLAREKAKSVFPKVLGRYRDGVIIAADTIVLAPKGDRVLGKPKSKNEAFKMLSLLVGKTHTVLTAYCLLSFDPQKNPQSFVRTVSSQVTLRALSKAGIQNYIRLDMPFDKAGSYAAQGLGMALIEHIRGSYTNVVGLPVTQLLRDLERRFGISPFLG